MVFILFLQKRKKLENGRKSAEKLQKDDLPSDLPKKLEDHWPNHSQRHRGLTHRGSDLPSDLPTARPNHRANHFDSRNLQQSGKMDRKQKFDFSEVQIQLNHYQNNSKSHERVSLSRNSNCNQIQHQKRSPRSNQKGILKP